MISWDGKSLSKFNGKDTAPTEGVRSNPLDNASLLMAADLCGDCRDELVLLVHDADGAVRVCIITAATPITTKHLSPTENLDYRLWLARNMGGGHSSTFPRP